MREAPLIKMNQSMGSCRENLEAKYLGSCTAFRWHPLLLEQRPAHSVLHSAPPGPLERAAARRVNLSTGRTHLAGERQGVTRAPLWPTYRIDTRKITLMEMRKGAPGPPKLSSTLLPPNIISESLGSKGLNSKTMFLVPNPYFTDEETEAQGGNVICLRPYSKLTTTLELESCLLDPWLPSLIA